MVRPYKILHLEDISFDADLVKRELKKSDLKFEFAWAQDETSFRSMLNDVSPDIILSDHSLPSFTSTTALKIARDEGYDVPFILITATMTDDDAVRLMNEGMADYIFKDRIKRLPSAIKNAIERYRSAKEKERYHKEVLRNERLFRSMIEKSIDMVTLSLPNGQTIYTSPSVTNVLGFTKDEFLSRSALYFVHPDDYEGLAEQMRQLLKFPGSSFYRKQRILNKKGTYTWCEGTVTNMLNDPDIGALISNFRDITERQRVETALIENKNRLKEAQQIAQVGSWELNFSKGVAVWSDEACRIYGLPLYENRQSFEEWISFVHPDDLAAVKEEIDRSQKTLSDSSIEHRIICRDGTIKHIHSVAKFEFDANKGPIGLFGVCHDITGRKKTEAALLQEMHLTKKHQSMQLSSQINPHFIFNALNSVQYFILTEEKTETTLNFVAEFSKLMRATLTNSQFEFIRIEDEIKFLEAYLNLECQRLKQKFCFDVSSSQGVNPGNCYIPPMVVQPYIENAVIHGLAHSENSTKISIRFSQKNGQIICKITDNGVGRKKAMELKEADPERKLHQSVGIKLTETRVKLLNELYGNSFHVQITDLFNADGTPKGTEVEIMFPALTEEMVFGKLS